MYSRTIRLCLNTIKKTFFIWFVLFTISCNHTPKIDFEKEKKEILSLDEQARTAHFTKNAKALVASFSKDFISINKGKISQPTFDESFQRFDTYFKQVEFVKWDNKKEPIVRFSEDASIAYVAVDKTVILKVKNGEGKEVLDTTYFAWLSVFKKINDKWELDCIASTNK